MLKIYQNLSTNRLRNEINNMGWGEAESRYPEVHAYMETSNKGAAGYVKGMMVHWTHVAFVDTDDPNEAFAAMNLWDGQGAQVTQVQSCRSLSVGDIVVNQRGEKFMCDPFGWTQID